MFKKIVSTSSILLALTLFAAPTHTLYASTVAIVSGGDPEPTGEPDKIAVVILAAQLALAVS